MNIDKTTFMGVIQAISSVLLVFGLDQFDSPETKDALWKAWVAIVGIAAGFKGFWSKSDDKKEPTNEINRLKIKGLKADVNESLANERVAKIRLAKYEAKYGAKKAE